MILRCALPADIDGVAIVVTSHRRVDTSVLSALIWFVASYGLAILGYLAANAIASRWLGLAQFSDFVVVLTVSTIVGQLALVGVHRGGLREAALLTDGDPAVLVTLRGAARAATTVTLPAAGVISGLVLYAVGDGGTAQRVAVAIGFGLLVVLSGQQKLWANYLRGFGDVRFASLLEGRSGGGIVSVVQASALVVAWLAFPDTRLAGAVVALVIGYLPPTALAGRRVSRRWAHLAATHHLWSDLVTAVRSNWRFAVNQLGAYLSGNVQLWIAAVVLIDTQASLFSAAQRLSLLLVIPLTSVQVVFAPVSARLLASGEIQRLQRVLRTGATIAMLATAVLWIPMLAIPGEVLRVVFGPDFQSAEVALSLLTLGSVANVATGLCGTVLIMSRHEGLVAGIQSVAVVLQVVLGVGAAELLGLRGLALSAALVIVLTFTVQWVLARRLLKVWTHPTLRPSLGALRRTSS